MPYQSDGHCCTDKIPFVDKLRLKPRTRSSNYCLFFFATFFPFFWTKISNKYADG